MFKRETVEYVTSQMSDTSIALVLVTNNLDEGNAAYGAVENFIDIYEHDVGDITIIGPRSIDIDREIIETIPIPRPVSDSKLSSVFGYIRYQMRIAKKIRQTSNHFDLVFFHIGGSMLLLPLIYNKLSDIRSVVFITGSVSDSFYEKSGHSLQSAVFVQLIKLIENITCTIADDVILLSESMDSRIIQSLSSTTTHIANINYIDSNKFEKQTQIEDRAVDIAFVGRLESVKGVQNLVHALPGLIKRNPDLQIKFIGDGKKREELEEFVKQHELDDHVMFTGWINREEIPNHLTNARTLLLPSVSEGVPKTILEAMSCGTIPIATPVGGIPDIIEDGSNGFLLQGSNPDVIEQTVSSVLHRDDLEIISGNARRYIKKKHSYGSIRNLYLDIMTENE